MNVILSVKKLAYATAATVAVLLANTAHAEEHVVQIRAYVPIECEADLIGNLTPLSAGSFRLGNIQQFCNTPFRMSVLHSSLASGAMFQFKGNFAVAGGTETLLNSSSSAANETAPIYLHGVDEEQATNASNTLVLALTPLGV